MCQPLSTPTTPCRMPTPLVSDLRKALGRENVLSAPSELAVYDCDAFTIERHRPEAVVFPLSAQQVAEAVKLCGRHGASVVARGAGTSLAGGCLPVGTGGADIPVCRPGDAVADKNVCPTDHHGGAVVVMLTRMNRILEIDLRNRMAVVEAGVANLRLTAALAGTGYHFAPDPSSQGASTIGGNVATNAGGPHTLKYGVTVNHVLGVEAVLADGSILQTWPVIDSTGPRFDRRVGGQRRHPRHRDEGLGPSDAERTRLSRHAGDVQHVGRRRQRRRVRSSPPASFPRRWN